MKFAGQIAAAVFLGLLGTVGAYAEEVFQPLSMESVVPQSRILSGDVARVTPRYLPVSCAGCLSDGCDLSAAAPSCDGGPLGCDACGGAAAGQPWSMPQPCLTQHLGIKVGGWLQQGYTVNTDHPNGTFNGPVATNDLDREYQMNQMWLYLARPADNGGCGWAWGGHIDMLYGTDWRFGINKGLEDRINGFDYQTYGMVIPQAYLEIAYNKLSVKLGHFAAILDYEVIPGPFNPLYSHSYSYGYTVPQLVTGVLGDYKLTDQLSVQGSLHRGWMLFEDNNEDIDFMAGVKWKRTDDLASIAYALSTGTQDPAGEQDRFVYSLVTQLQLWDDLRYVLVHNLGLENNALPTGQDAEWYGLNQYFMYTINPRWKGVLRAEWLRDDDGARVAGPGNIPGVRAFSGRGFAGNFYEVTLGANWTPHPNLLVRPEIRYDWYDGLSGPTGLPFDDGNSDDQLLLAVDAVLTF